MASVQAGLRKARALCEQKGETFTPLRQRVLEIVLKHRGPMKAYDILRELQREQEKAAPPTAYRALDFLVSVGMLHRIESLSAYVACTHEQPGHGGLFFVCDKCHRIIEQQDSKIDRLLAKKGEEAGFRVSSHEVEVHGTCDACA
jgi:Fur family transcriptional regulator, zinc uptake regulator